MANYLWNVVAIRNNGKVTKGMNVEILKIGNSGKPNQSEIADALNREYNCNIHDEHCGSSVFSFTKLS